MTRAPESIPEAFDRVASAMPERIAIASADRRITYAELATRSDVIAADLRRRGVRPGAIVGLFIARSVDAIVAILGVLKAGAAYLPFDSSYPVKLLRYIYEDSAPSLMLVHETCSEQIFWDGETLEVDALSHAESDAQTPDAMPRTPDDLAYVMYTSGSTGRPKGVLIPHRGVLSLVLDNPFVQLDTDAVLLQLSPLAFDASTFEIWGALLNGGTLALLPAPQPSLDDIAQAIQRHCVTTMFLTTAVFHLMVDHRLDALRGLRELLPGGDVLSPTHMARAVHALPDVHIVACYGPTENTTFTTCYPVPKDFSSANAVPIGKAVARTEAHVLDGAGRPAGDGQEGELYVGGAGLARGYLNRPELTAERFVPHPFDTTPGARLYRTGDRARRDTDGNLHFLGRVDRQIKINGKRVELDEIEACLRRSPLVRDAAAISYEAAGLRRVAAFVTSATGQPAPMAQLRAFLQQELPDYMNPSTLSVLDALPLSPNGKVDRARLPLPRATAHPYEMTATAGDVGATLLLIWRHALGIETIAADDNFFDLGGTSLQMIQVHAAIQAFLKRDAKLVDLFKYPNIGALAKWITRAAPRYPIQSNAQDRARRQRAALERARHGR